jgi:hypothetical protein
MREEVNNPVSRGNDVLCIVYCTLYSTDSWSLVVDRSLMVVIIAWIGVGLVHCRP